MKQAILVGNGFSSQLIEAYKNHNLNRRIGEIIPDYIRELNELFSEFRFNIEESDIYKLLNEKFPSDHLYPSKNLYLGADSIQNNNSLSKHIKSKILEQDLDINSYQKLFIESGLIFETIHPEISNFEALIKISTLFKRDYTDEIKKVSSYVCFNDGNNDLKSSKLQNYKKTSHFFEKFDYIYTTNYDLILDDLSSKDVYHLHGSFNIRKVIEGNKTFYVKTEIKLDPDNAYLIWGINGEEKTDQMSAGIGFPIQFPLSMPASLLKGYLDGLAYKDYEIIHIFGYSGENDQHINYKIAENPNVREIIYYCNPNKIGDKNFEKKIIELFDRKSITFKSWDIIWNEMK